MGILENAFPFHSIPPGATGFLVIIFYALGNIIMNNEPDVRFIDTHTKRDSGNNYLYIFIEKLILPFGSDLTVDPGMISNRLNIIFLKKFSELFCCFSICCVDDPTLPFILTDESHQAF